MSLAHGAPAASPLLPLAAGSPDQAAWSGSEEGARRTDTEAQAWALGPGRALSSQPHSSGGAACPCFPPGSNPSHVSCLWG